VRTTAALLLAVLSVAGCTSAPAGEPTATDVPSSTSSAAVKSWEQEVVQHDFGATVTVGTSTVTVGAPEAFTPSTVAKGAEGGGRAGRVKITVVNNGTSPVPGNMVLAQAAAGDKELPSVVDTVNGTEVPTQDIRPGQTVTWLAGFMAPEQPGELTVRVLLGLTGDKNNWRGRF